MKDAYLEELLAGIFLHFMGIKCVESNFCKCSHSKAAETEQCIFDFVCQCDVILWAYLNITIW
jgi:hypothetical protein